jgi:predicted KAP-like P-loop ATPase
MANDWLRDLRVCHPEIFDRYFQLAVPEHDISQAEIDRILELAGDRGGLVEHLRSLHERDLLALAVARLESYKDDVDLDHAVPFITALFDIGELLPKREGFFGMGADMHTIRVIHWYLKREASADKRYQVLRQAIENTSGIYLPVNKTSIETSKEGKARDPETFLVETEVIGDLQSLCVEKIKAAAASGELRTNPHLGYILFRWNEWDDSEEPRAWIEQLVSSDEGLVTFLNAMASKVTSIGLGSYASHSQWKTNLKSVEVLIPLEILTQRLADLNLASVDIESRYGTEAFSRALERRAQGKSDDDW